MVLTRHQLPAHALKLDFCDSQTGPGPKINSQPLLKRGMHRRKIHIQRRLLHPEARNQHGSPQVPEHPEHRDRPPHHLGPLQPANRAPDPVLGLEAGPDEGAEGRRERVLGNQHGVPDRGVQVRGRDQHRAQREDDGDHLPVREVVEQSPGEGGGDVEDRGG